MSYAFWGVAGPRLLGGHRRCETAYRSVLQNAWRRGRYAVSKHAAKYPRREMELVTWFIFPGLPQYQLLPKVGGILTAVWCIKTYLFNLFRSANNVILPSVINLVSLIKHLAFVKLPGSWDVMFSLWRLLSCDMWRRRIGYQRKLKVQNLVLFRLQKLVF